MYKIYAFIILTLTHVVLATADIEIIYNGVSVNNSDTINVGDINIGLSLNSNFIIKNIGTDGLTINSLSQTNGTDFTVNQPVKSTLVNGDTTIVQFSFTPTCESVNKFTTVTLNSNDQSQPTFNLVIQGGSIDTLRPTITCPSNIEKCGAQIVNYADPIVNDNCILTNISQKQAGLSSGELFPLGSSNQVFEITDNAGNTAQCSFDVTIYDSPSPANISQSLETICDSSFLLQAETPVTGIGYWARVSQKGEILDTLSSSTLLSNIPYGSSDYSWNVTNGNCSVSSDTISIIRDIEPTDAITSDDQELCNNSSTTLVANDPGPVVGFWSIIKGNSTIQLPNENITQASFLSPDTNQFTWTIPSQNSCSNSIDTINIINSLAPQSGAIVANNNVCGSVDTVRALKPNIGVGRWSVITGSGALLTPEDTSSIVTNLSIGSNQFVWEVSNGGCPSEKDTLTITRDQDIVANAGTPQTVCADSVKLNAETPIAGSGVWFTDNSFVFQNQADANTIVKNLNSGSNIFVWIVTNGVCVNSDVVLVSYNNDITPSDAGDDQKICDETQTLLEAETAGDAAGSWSIAQGSATIDNPSSRNSVIRNINDSIVKAVWEISAFGCNSSYDTVTIIRDTIAPTITCPGDTIIYSSSSSCNVTFEYIEPIGLDDCPNAITTLIDGRGSNALYSLGVDSNTYQVTDATFGLQNQCTFSVTVKDTIKPIVDCPPNISTVTDPGECGKIYSFNLPTATDNCSAPLGGLVVTQTGGGLSGTEFPVGTTTLVFSTTDSSNNIGTCSTDVIVIDNQKPSITCPQDTIVFTNFNECEATVNYNDPIATDNCPNFIVSEIFPNTESGASFPIGTTFVGYRVNDLTGKGASCTFNIIVRDTITPIVTCPNDTNIFVTNNECERTYSFSSPNSTDNCQIKSVIQNNGPSSGGTFFKGVNTISYIITDSSDNSSSCSFNVTVSDTAQLSIICPDNINKVVDATLCGAITSFISPVVINNCDERVISQTDVTGLSSGSLFPVGVTTLTFEISDSLNNSSSCSFDINVTDNEVPTVICPNDTVISANFGQCDAIFEYDSLIAGTNMFDNCTGVSFTKTDTSGLSSGSTFPIGSTTLVFEIEDDYNNVTNCSYSVTVIDTEKPTINCPNDTLVYLGLDACEKVVNYIAPIANDNCPNFIVTNLFANTESGASFSLGTSVIRYKVNDLAGNDTTCSFNITVSDTTKPIVTCPNDTIIFVTNNECERMYSFDPPSSTDNCQIKSVIQSKGPNSGGIFIKGINTISYDIIDSSDNVSSCSFNVTVSDTAQLSIICPDNINKVVDATLCGAITSFTSPVVINNCDERVISQTDTTRLSSGSLFPVGVTTLTFEISDSLNNSSSCSFDINVIDNEVPTVICPNDTVISANFGQCDAVFEYDSFIVDSNMFDNCSGVTFNKTDTSGLSSGSTFPIGVTKLVFEIEDDYNNVTNCSYRVTVIDTENPTINCPSDTIVYLGLDACEKVVNYTTPFANDNCPNFIVTNLFANTESGSSFSVGTTTIGYKVIDLVGNDTTCTFDILVKDTIVPVVSCPNDTIIFATGNQCGRNYTFESPSVLENCQIQNITQNLGPKSGEFFSLGDNIVNYTVSDSSGNENSCSFNVTVSDTTKPLITCPGNITKAADSSVCGAITTFLQPSILDNCAGSKISRTDFTGLSSGNIFPVGLTTLSFVVTDSSDNTSSSCSFNVEIIDNESPEVDCPNDVSLNTAIGQCTSKFVFDSFSEGVNIFDNCPGVTSKQTDNTNLSSGSNFPIGKTTLVFEISDKSNNTTACSFNVTVVDNEIPKIVCPSDTILNTSGNLCATNYNYTLPTSSDNCSSPTISFISGIEQGGTFSLGNTSVVYQAEDQSGNINECSFNVIVIDSIAPEIVCSNLDETIFVGLDCKAEYSFSINANDNCDSSPNISQHRGSLTTSKLEIGTYDYWFTAKDNSNNVSDTCKYSVSVEDNTLPVLECPETVTFCAEQVYNFPNATVSDNCSNDLVVEQIQGPVSGSNFEFGINTIKFESKDSTGNIGSCAFDVIILDTTLVPEINIGESIGICDTIIPLSVVNTRLGIVHKWIIINGQGRLSDSMAVNTILDSLSRSTSVTILLTSQFGNCTTKKDTSFIEVKDNPVISGISPSYLLCDLSELTIEPIVDNSETFKWKKIKGPIIDLGKDSVNSTITIEGLQNDEVYEFSFTASSPRCKDSVVNFEVIVSETPILTISEDTTIYYGETIPLEVFADQDDITTNWFVQNTLISNSEEINVSPKETTLYKAIVTNSKGCVSSDSTKVIYQNGIKVYSGITANGDNVNDYWVIRGIKSFPNAKVQVFSQWGQKIYTSDNGYDEPWDATHNGEVVPFGVYYYIVDLGDGSKKETGTITVLR